MSSLREILSSAIFCFLFSRLGHLQDWFQADFGKISKKAGFEDDRPRSSIVVLSLMFLCIFFVTSVFAIKFPFPATKVIICTVNSLLSATLLLLFLLDITSRRHRPYRRNLANTVLTVLLTIIVLTALYANIWYDSLNREAILLSSNSVSAPRVPAVALLQGVGNSFAVLQDSPLKCFLGEWLDHAPLCTDLTSQEVGQLPSCDCSDRWPSLETLERGANKIFWRGQNMTYYAMLPSESMVTGGVYQPLTLEIFFSYNTTEVHANSSVTYSPGIFVALFDPAYDLHEVMSSNLAQVARIDANSITVINVGLRRYEYLHRRPSPIYVYDPTFYPQPNLDLVCDVTKEGWYPCHLHLDIVIPFMLETVVREVKELSWSGLVAQAGAYFALVQFFSWMISGQAWAR